MGVDHDDRHLDIAGEDRRNRRAGDAQPRKAELAEDQQIVEHQIDQNGRNAGEHRQARLAHLAQRARVDLRNRERQKTQQHDQQVILAKAHRARHVRRIGSLGQIQTDQLLGEQQEHRECEHEHHDGNQPLDAEAVPDALVVLRPGKLRGKDARPRQTAEDTEIKDEEKLVDNSHRGHLKRAYAAHHDVVQQADHVGDGILNDDRHDDGDHRAVKRAVTDKRAPQTRAKFPLRHPCPSSFAKICVRFNIAHLKWFVNHRLSVVY